jgi:hypothetical protein
MAYVLSYFLPTCIHAPRGVKEAMRRRWVQPGTLLPPRSCKTPIIAHAEVKDVLFAGHTAHVTVNGYHWAYHRWAPRDQQTSFLELAAKLMGVLPKFPSLTGTSMRERPAYSGVHGVGIGVVCTASQFVVVTACVVGATNMTS